MFHRHKTAGFGVVRMAALWLGSAGLAAAQQSPVFLPTRAVTVSYKLTGASQMNGATKLRISYSSQPGQVRMDFYRSLSSSDPFGSLIFDQPRNRVITLLPERAAYLQRDAAGLANPGQLLSPAMHYVRHGTEQLAGLTCTDWTVTTGERSGTACVTDDGVALKATRGKPTPGEMDAIAVDYTDPPPDAFFIPPGFSRLASAPPAR